MKITGYQPQSDLEKSASRDALEQNKHTTDNTDKDITVWRKLGIYLSKREHFSSLITSPVVKLLINVAPIYQSNDC